MSFSVSSVLSEAFTVGHGVSAVVGAFLHKLYAKVYAEEQKVVAKVEAGIDAAKKA